MKLIYLLLAALALTILTSFLPNLVVKEIPKPKTQGFVSPAVEVNEYAPLNIDADFGLWYIIPGTKKYNSHWEENSLPCFNAFKYYGYPFATTRDVCSRIETNLITIMMNFIIYLVLLLLGYYINRIFEPKNIQR